MNFPEASFVVIESRNCPLYGVGDEFKLYGRSLSLAGKPACLTLMNDITHELLTIEELRTLNMKADGKLFNCGGKKTDCVGSIRLGYHKERKPEEIKKQNHEIAAIADVLNKFSIFRSLNKQETREIVSYFRIKRFPVGEVVLKKGDPGVKLYIIVSGKVEVLGDKGISIAFLGQGEVFGEMSLLSGDPVSSTVRVSENAKIMYMYGNYFRKVVNRYPSIQLYFARLLSRRLAKSNVARSMEVNSGMTGSLAEITPAELLQTLNLTQKTGVLHLNLPDGGARMSFREGHLVNVEYDKKTGEDAFFELLHQKSGRFVFQAGLSEDEMKAPRIGDFMWLLMEGLNRMDEKPK